MDVKIERSPYRFLDTEEAYEFVSQGYARIVPQVRQRVRSIAHTGSVASTGTLRVDRMSHGVSASGTMDAYTDLTLVCLREGRFDLDFRRFGCAQAGPGQSWMYMREGPATMTWEPFEAELVRLPWDVVTARAAALTGVDPERLRFESISPVTPQAAHRWQAVSALVLAHLTAPGAEAMSALVHHTLVDLVVASVLGVFPSSAMTRGEAAGAGAVHPASVRRAIAFIDEHAHQAITTADVARSARLSVRGLQAGFQRSIGTSPSRYLRRARLDGARRDLLAADGPDDATVGAIARRWGFAHAGRFAVEYREAFGEPPSTTLRR